MFFYYISNFRKRGFISKKNNEIYLIIIVCFVLICMHTNYNDILRVNIDLICNKLNKAIIWYQTHKIFYF